MINREDIYGVVDSYYPHTTTSIDESNKPLLPIYNSGKMYPVDKYRYKDKWHYYEYSSEYPERAYGIIYVENMPYLMPHERYSNKSFMARVDRMIYLHELKPFLLFVNNRFVKWSEITIVYDHGNTYLKLHNYRYYKDYMKKIDMIIMPMNIVCTDSETDYLFDIHYDAMVNYLNDSSRIIDGKFIINVPYIGDEYDFEDNSLDIGAWMYNQIRLNSLGLLNRARFNKLRQVPVEQPIYSANGEVADVMITTFNIFDRDSCRIVDFESMLNIQKDQLLFRFDFNGLLVSNDSLLTGTTDVYTTEGHDYDISWGSTTLDRDATNTLKFTEFYPNTEQLLSKENFILFKNDQLCTDEITNDRYNLLTMYFSKGVLDEKGNENLTLGNYITISWFLIVNKKSSSQASLTKHFNNTAYLYNIIYENYKNGSSPWCNDFCKFLDYSFSNKKLYEENYEDNYKTLLDYDINLFNDLYHSPVYSECMTGAEANALLDKPFDYNTRHGLKIPKRMYHDHEVNAIVFVNGEIISTYSDSLTNPNWLYVPVDGTFKDTDTIEILYFLNCNNNELEFTYTLDTKNYEKFIPSEDLKVFSTAVSDLLEYPNQEYDLENISFPVYSDDTNTDLLSHMVAKKVVAVSRRKFVYERLYVQNRAFRIRLDDKRFRYCDNQGQYYLFINGRRILDDSFLITIPKVTRPFDHFYIYSTKFFQPTDRIELFYLPIELPNTNEDDVITVAKNGYIECDMSTLEVPYDPRYYLFFINGKKIPNCNLLQAGSNRLRISVDTKTYNTLVINNVYDDTIPEVKERLSTKTLSLLDTAINNITNYGSDLYETLDTLLATPKGIYMSDTENNALVRQVGLIAILNEIVRDFWVTNGYPYEEGKFLYDFKNDEYIDANTDNDPLLIPAMDATAHEINLQKDPLHALYFTYADSPEEELPEYYEMGTTIINPKFIWEFEDIYAESIEMEYQDVNGRVLENDARTTTFAEHITEDTTYVLTATDGYVICTAECNIKFCNSIFYGLVDEDTLDGKASDIYTNNYQKLLDDITKLTQPELDISLTDYVVGNNAYFIYAAPKRLVYDENDGHNKVSFFLPRLEDIAHFDDKTKPVYTNGKLDESNLFIELDKFEMEELATFKYTNSAGYKEDYVVYKSTGFFTRLYEDTKFDIFVKTNELETKTFE